MLPFSNVTVLDLTHVIAGPFCTYQLAVMGANVIKVESPTEPDMMRATNHEFPAGELGLGCFFTSQNANKKAISVDLKSEKGREIIRQLVKNTDVLVENYRAGALADLGLGYDDLVELKPDIIYCSMTGFGQDGPLGGRTAYDNVIQSSSGLMSANGDNATAPVKVGPPVLDYASGSQAAFAIAGALYQRAFSGEGQHIDMSMLDASLMLMSANVTYYDRNKELIPLTGNMSANYAGYSCFDTSDGQIMLGAYTSRQVKDMWKVLGDPEYGEKLGTYQSRELHPFRETDETRLAALLMEDTAANWEVRFNQGKVPASRVRKLDEALADPQLETRGVIQTLPEDEAGWKIPVAAFKYRKNGPKLTSLPPVFAQHTREILTGLGYEAEQIDALATDGAIAVADLLETGA